MPELRGVRVGPGRLCGHRIIHTHLKSQADRHEARKNGKNGSESSGKVHHLKRSERLAESMVVDKSAVSGAQESIFSKESLHCLAKNRLDLLAQIEVDPAAPFSRSRGEQTKMADAVHIAHL